jgi:predicted dinucleotide-binding enzyme
MRIGIIGSGSIGGTLAALFGGRGHEIRLANSRGPQSLRDLPEGVRAATVEEAARDSEVVVVAIPFGRFTELPAEAFYGTVVVDAGNYYPQRDGVIPQLDDGSTTSTELVAAHLKGARAVKAFNTLYYVKLREDGRPDAPAADRLAIPLAGDDADAKRLVSGLIEEIGFAPVDAGALANGRRQQPGTPLYGQSVGPDQARELLDRTP